MAEGQTQVLQSERCTTDKQGMLQGLAIRKMPPPGNGQVHGTWCARHGAGLVRVCQGYHTKQRAAGTVLRYTATQTPAVSSRHTALKQRAAGTVSCNTATQTFWQSAADSHTCRAVISCWSVSPGHSRARPRIRPAGPARTPWPSATAPAAAHAYRIIRTLTSAMQKWCTSYPPHGTALEGDMQFPGTWMEFSRRVAPVCIVRWLTAAVAALVLGGTRATDGDAHARAAHLPRHARVAQEAVLPEVHVRPKVVLRLPMRHLSAVDNTSAERHLDDSQLTGCDTGPERAAGSSSKIQARGDGVHSCGSGAAANTKAQHTFSPQPTRRQRKGIPFQLQHVVGGRQEGQVQRRARQPAVVRRPVPARICHNGALTYCRRR